MADTILRQLFSPLSAETDYVPTRSAITATVIALVTFLSGSIVLEIPLLATGGLLLGVVLAGAIAAVDHDRLRGPLFGGAVLLATTAAALGVPLYLVSTGERTSAATVSAGVLIAFGLASFRLDTVGNGAVSRAVAWVARVAALLAIFTLVFVTAFFDVQYFITDPRFADVFGALLVPLPGGRGVLGLTVLSLLTLASLWLTTGALPPDNVFNQPFRNRYRVVVSTTAWLATLVFGASTFTIVIAHSIGRELGLAPDVVGPPLDALTASLLVRGVLIRLILIAAIVTVLLRVLRAAGPELVYGRPAWLPSGGLVTGVLAVGGFLGGNTLVELLDPVIGTTASLTSVAALLSPQTVGMGILLIGVLAVGGTLLLLPTLSGLGLLPTYTAGARIVLGGLLCAGIAAATGDAPVVVVYMTIVAAIVVWDIGEHGAELTADVGTTPARRDGELLHAGGSLLVGGVIVAVIFGANQLFTQIVISEDVTLTVIGLGVVAVLVLAVLFKK